MAEHVAEAADRVRGAKVVVLEETDGDAKRFGAVSLRERFDAREAKRGLASMAALFESCNEALTVSGF